LTICAIDTSFLQSIPLDAASTSWTVVCRSLAVVFPNWTLARDGVHTGDGA
jgi:hypothetical protein